MAPRGLARAAGAAYVVFTDATLTAIAEAVPDTTDGLSAIPGVGPRKLDLYGADVLAVLAGEARSSEPSKNQSHK